MQVAPSRAGFPSLPRQRRETPAKSRRKVCIASFDFVGPIRNGGVGTAFTSLGEALAAAGHEVTFLYLSGNHCETSKPLSTWIADYAAKGIRFEPLPEWAGPRLESPWHMAKAYEAYEWLKQRRFDVIHFSEWRSPGYYSLVAKRQGLAFQQTTLCVHTHGPTLWSLLSNAEYLNRLEELELDFMERESVRLADVVVSPSQYLLRWMQERGWKLPEQTYVQQYIRPASATPPARGASGPARVKELVFFGRLEIRKGLVLFCDALDRLVGHPSLSGVNVTFLGKPGKVNDCDGGDYLRDRAQGWPWRWSVISDKDQPGAIDYLRGEGRLALIPSLVDNLPNTVLECLGAGVAFLASTTGGIPETMQPADAAEILFPLQTAAFAEKIVQAVERGVRPAHFAVDPGENLAAWIEWHSEIRPSMEEPGTRSEPGPVVSVCLSHFNRPELLRQALASIERQDYRNLEVVLVDDASSKPEAIAYIDSLEPLFEARGWQLIRNAREMFVGAARNLAARRARGDYLKFMDDDNFAKPEEISTFVGVAQRTAADIVTCALDFFSGNEAPKEGDKAKFRFLFLGPAAAPGALRNYFGDTNALFRKEVFLDLGGFHEENRVGNEDWKLMGAAVLKGYKLESVPEALVWYRRTETGSNASARNSLHGGHMQNIQPYLDAVRPELRNLILYAQGVSVGGDAPANELVPYIRLTTLWKSKLEAGRILSELGQRAIAVKLMLEGIKSVRSCGSPRVILEALMEIGQSLVPLDPGRARFLLEMAIKLGASHNRKREVESVRMILVQMSRAKAEPMSAASAGEFALALQPASAALPKPESESLPCRK